MPVLGKLLFGKDHQEKSRGELLIALVPHIVRTPDYQPDNLRSVELNATPAVPVAIVVADPTGAVGGLYLERALSLAGNGEEFDVQVLDGREVARWEPERLARQAAVFVAGTRTLDRNGRDRLRSYLDGGGQVLVCSGNNGYLFDLQANTFTQVRTGATTMGVHLDGYFIVLDAATSTIYLSDLLDGTTWDPTQFAQRSTASDPWVSMAVLDRFLYLFGTQTSEAWFDGGTFPFPFQPHPSGLMPVGCAAPFSARVAGNLLMWLGATRDGEGQVYRAAGFTPEPAGTFALAVALESYGVVADAIGDSYTDQGHTFYVLTLPTAGVTWACDVTSTLQIGTGLRWTQRGSWDSAHNAYQASRALYHLYVPHTSAHLVLDRDGAGVYRLTTASAVDVDDRPIRRVRRAPALFDGNRELTVPVFELLLEPGLGAVSGQGLKPQVALRISRDGGKTWGSERWRTAGARGRYGARVRWLRNGCGRRWMPEVVVSDPVPWRLLGAVLQGVA